MLTHSPVFLTGRNVAKHFFLFFCGGTLTALFLVQYDSSSSSSIAPMVRQQYIINYCTLCQLVARSSAIIW